MNPIYAGDNLLPMQGTSLSTLEPGLRRAGNLFYDRDFEELSTKHIRSSFGFKYNAANSPDEAVPEYISPNVEVEPFFESNNLSCSEEELPCVLSPCNPSEWQELLLNTTEEDSIVFYQQELLYSIAQQDDISESVSILELLSDSVDYLELLIGIHLNLNNYEAASFALQNHSVITERDQDYYNFYTSILDREFNEIPSDSIPNSDSTLYADIMSHGNDVSDLVKAYLNFNFDFSFVVSPELWEEESSRPIFNPEQNSKDRTYNQKTKLNTSIHPNPSNKELFVSYISNEHNQLTISISNVLGEIVLNKLELKNNIREKIEINNIPSGVYYISFNSEHGRISVEKIVIIH